MLDIFVEMDKGFWFLLVIRDGLVYFGVYFDKLENYGKSDIYSFNLINGEISNFSLLNIEFEEWDLFIVLDESYMIFVFDCIGGFGVVDYYIFFKVEGVWGIFVNMGLKINFLVYDVVVKVIFDQRFILFDWFFKED